MARWPKASAWACKDSSAAPFDFGGSLTEAGEELVDVFLHLGFGAVARIRRHFLAHPVPDRLVGVEIRTVRRQRNQPQVQARRRQVGPNGRAAMSRAIVPDKDQRLGILRPQLPQKGNRRFGCAVLRHHHGFHFAALHTYGRIVVDLLLQFGAGRVDQRRFAPQDPFLTQIGVSPEVGFIDEEDLGPLDLGLDLQLGIQGHESSPLLRLGLHQPLLGALQHKT